MPFASACQRAWIALICDSASRSIAFAPSAVASSIRATRRAIASVRAVASASRAGASAARNLVSKLFQALGSTLPRSPSRHLCSVSRNQRSIARQSRGSPSNVGAWGEGSGYSVHLAWHQALFHLDAGEVDAALELYDTHIAPAPAALASLADASALLWRLRLRDADIGSRWHALADRWQTQSLAGARAFYSVHATMAFAAAGRDARVAQALDTLRSGATRAPLEAAPDDLIGPLLCEAFVAFVRRDYSACCEVTSRRRPTR